MIIKLGEGESVTVNMLQACFWKVRDRCESDGQALYQIVFSGNAKLDLTKDESVAFEQFIDQSSKPKLIQPVQGNLIQL